MRIVVAEDGFESRDLLAFMLGRAGHTVEALPNGALAWEAVQREHAPLLITDCMMPEMDGFELCRRVRAAKPYTYVIMLTAYTGRENYRSGMDAGADDFLVKPCDFEALEARLKVADRILGLHREVQQLSGLLPICSYCKKIRDAESTWVPIEVYVSHRSDASFSHGVCPECYRAHVQPELNRAREER